MQLKTVLAAKVEARNKLNKNILEQVPKLIEALKPFVGKKIKLATGGFTKTIQVCFPSGTVDDVQFFLSSSSRYSVYAHFRTSVNTPTRTVYAENEVAIGGMSDGQTLEKVCEFLPVYYRTDYTEGEVTEHRASVEYHEDKARHHEHALTHFGRHDNS